MARITDSTGREREALIAEKTVTVPDPLHGFGRKVMAGQPVPADLESAYRTAVGKKKRSTSARRSSGKKRA